MSDGALLGLRVRAKSDIERVIDTPVLGGEGSFNSRAATKTPGLHLVRDVRYGDDRRVRCTACSFIATGRSDEAMATNFHVHAVKANSGKPS